MHVINNFIDVVNRAVFYKYDLLSKPKLSLKGQDLQLARNYKSQELEEIKGNTLKTTRITFISILSSLITALCIRKR